MPSFRLNTAFSSQNIGQLAKRNSFYDRMMNWYQLLESENIKIFLKHTHEYEHLYSFSRFSQQQSTEK
jgi:hypothetical protein